MTRGQIRATSSVIVLLGLAAPIGCGVTDVADGPRRLRDYRRVEQPDAVMTSSGGLALVWGAVAEDGSADVAISSLGERGEPIAPSRVNPRPGTAVAGRQVGPRIAVCPGGRLLVSWVDRAADPAGDILIVFSDDGGRTFSRPVRVNDDEGSRGQEYHGLAVLADGTVAVVWLDERDAPATKPNEKQVYLALSRDGGESFESNLRLTSSPAGVCPCCRPSVVASAAGSLHVTYRDRIGERLLVRVRTRAAGREQFSPPVDAPVAPWKFSGCPVDGPSVAAGDGELLIAWKDGTAGEERVWVARSDDGGLSFGAPRAVATAMDSQRRPKLLVDEDLGTIAAWEDGSGRVWLRALGAGEKPLLLSSDAGAVSHSVTLVSAADGVHAVWVEETASVAALSAVTISSGLRHARVIAKDGRIRLAVTPERRAALAHR